MYTTQALTTQERADLLGQSEIDQAREIGATYDGGPYSEPRQPGVSAFLAYMVMVFGILVNLILIDAHLAFYLPVDFFVGPVIQANFGDDAGVYFIGLSYIASVVILLAYRPLAYLAFGQSENDRLSVAASLGLWYSAVGAALTAFPVMIPAAIMAFIALMGMSGPAAPFEVADVLFMSAPVLFAGGIFIALRLMNRFAK